MERKSLRLDRIANPLGYGWSLSSKAWKSRLNLRVTAHSWNTLHDKTGIRPKSAMSKHVPAFRTPVAPATQISPHARPSSYLVIPSSSEDSSARTPKSTHTLITTITLTRIATVFTIILHYCLKPAKPFRIPVADTRFMEASRKSLMKTKDTSAKDLMHVCRQSTPPICNCLRPRILSAHPMLTLVTTS